jgi:hypothetical protein
MPSIISASLNIEPSNQSWVEDPLPPELFSSTIQHVNLGFGWWGNTTLQFIARIRSLKSLELKGFLSQSSLPKYCLPASLQELELDHITEGALEIEEISLPCLEMFTLWVPSHQSHSTMEPLSFVNWWPHPL